jgi:hypothetical protein
MTSLQCYARGSALSLMAAAGLASAGLPPGLSGAWYNPGQSGHGLSIDIVSRESAIVSWSAMDMDGRPFNLYIEARIEGEGLSGRALAPRGLRFGEWNRADLRVPDWGEIRIDFTDCEHATLSWTANGDAGVGFPDGSMPLRRLTQLAGIRCDFGEASDPPLPVGTLALSVPLVSDRIPPIDDRFTYAAIDPEGRLWATQSWRRLPSEPPKFPIQGSIGSITDAWPKVIVGTPVAAGGGALELDVRTLQPPSYDGSNLGAGLATGSIEVTTGGGVSGRAFPVSPQTVDFREVSFTSDVGDLAYPGALADVDRTLDFAGRYLVTLSTQFFDFPGAIVVDAQGVICLQRHVLWLEEPCLLSGQLQLAFTGAAFFDFTLERPELSGAGETYAGRGWLQSSALDPSRIELVLVGIGSVNGAVGLAGVRE